MKTINLNVTQLNPMHRYDIRNEVGFTMHRMVETRVHLMEIPEVGCIAISEPGNATSISQELEMIADAMCEDDRNRYKIYNELCGMKKSLNAGLESDLFYYLNREQRKEVRFDMRMIEFALWEVTSAISEELLEEFEKCECQ